MGIHYNVYYALVLVAKWQRGVGLPDPELIWKDLQQERERTGMIVKAIIARKKLAVIPSNETLENLYYMFVVKEYPILRCKILCGEPFTLDEFPCLAEMFSRLSESLDYLREDGDYEQKEEHPI